MHFVAAMAAGWRAVLHPGITETAALSHVALGMLAILSAADCTTCLLQHAAEGVTAVCTLFAGCILAGVACAPG